MGEYFSKQVPSKENLTQTGRTIWVGWPWEYVHESLACWTIGFAKGWLNHYLDSLKLKFFPWYVFLSSSKAYENSSILRNCNKIQPWSLYKQSCWKIQVWNCIPILSFGFSFGNVLLGSFGGSRQVVWWINWWVGRFGFLMIFVFLSWWVGDDETFPRWFCFNDGFLSVGSVFLATETGGFMIHFDGSDCSDGLKPLRSFLFRWTVPVHSDMPRQLGRSWSFWSKNLWPHNTLVLFEGPAIPNESLSFEIIGPLGSNLPCFAYTRGDGHQAKSRDLVCIYPL